MVRNSPYDKSEAKYNWKKEDGGVAIRDRNRSDHLIFDVANDKQDPVTERATWIPHFQLEPFPCWTLLSNPFWWEWFPVQLGAPSDSSDLPQRRRKNSPPPPISALWAVFQEAAQVTCLVFYFLQMIPSLAGWWCWEIPHGRADFTSHLCFSSQDEQCQVDL